MGLWLSYDIDLIYSERRFISWNFYSSSAPKLNPLDVKCQCLLKCDLPTPVYFLADEKPIRCLTDKASLHTIVSSLALSNLNYGESKSTVAFTLSYGQF